MLSGSSGLRLWHIQSTACKTPSRSLRPGAVKVFQAFTRGCRVVTGRTTCALASDLTFSRDVGLFRYWSLPNVPLFLLAAPMLWVLIQSSVTVIRSCLQPPVRGRLVPQGGVTTSFKSNSLVTHTVPELVLPEFMLSIAAITSFHVQIVNRIASGYPMWYLTIAIWLTEGQASSANVRPKTRGQWAVRGMISYAMIQGILYANFLPPA